MMVLTDAPAAMAPPNDGVNENVAALEDFAATRSVNAMVNVGLVTVFPIWPETMVAGLALASAAVWMETELAPAVTAPMVSTVSTTVTTVLAAMAVAPVSVITILFVVGSALVAVDAPVVPAVKLTVGVVVAAKKLLG